MKNPEYRQPFIPLSWTNRELARLNEVVFDQTGKQLYVRLSETNYEPLIKANAVFRLPIGEEKEGVIGLVPAPNRGDEYKILAGDAHWYSASELVSKSGSFKGATPSTDGTGGFVPAPKKTNVTDFLCGDGQWRNISEVAASFKPGIPGLVPAPASSGDSNKLLTGNGTWRTALDVIDNFTGATQTVAGKRGTVLAPPAGSQLKFLQGNGGWSNPIDILPNYSGATSSKAGTKGFVPAPPAGAQTKFLLGNGTWANILDIVGNFGGATSTTAGTRGTVPAPPAGSQDKVLKGNGTWQDESGVIISGSSPSNKKALWVDNNSIMRYFKPNVGWTIIQTQSVWA